MTIVLPIAYLSFVALAKEDCLLFFNSSHQRYTKPDHQYPRAKPQNIDEWFLDGFDHHPIFLSRIRAQSKLIGLWMNVE